MASSRRQDNGDWKAGWLSQFLLLVFMMTLVAYQPTEGCISVAGADIINCTYGDTTDQSTCEASGCCWDITITPKCFLYEQAITGFSVEVPPAELSQTSSFSVEMVEGTDILVLVDYGSDIIELAWLADFGLVPSFDIVYEETGKYNATVWAFNAETLEYKDIVAFVDIPIQATVQVTHTDIIYEESTDPTFLIDVTAGSNVVIYMDPGYGDVDWYYYESAPISVNFTPPYTIPDAYNASVTISNSVSSLENPYYIRYGIPITDFKYEATPLVAVNANASFTMTFSSVSTTCVVTFADGLYDLLYEGPLFASMSTEYAYPEPDIYSTTVVCSNAFGDVTDTKDVWVQVPVDGLHFPVDDVPVIHADAGAALSVAFKVDNGTDLLFTVLCNGESCGSVSLDNPQAGSVSLDPEVLAPNGYADIAVQLTAANNLSSTNATQTVSFDTALSDCKISAQSFFFAATASTSLELTCLTGTRAQLWFDGGQDVEPSTTAVTDLSTTTHVETASFTKIGCYSINFTAQNNVSSQIVIETACVEVVLPAASDTSWDYLNTTDLDTVIFKVLFAVTAEPTNVLAKWDYGDGKTLEEMVSFTIDNLEFAMSSTHTYEVFGIFTVTCQMHNNVSSLNVSTSVQIGEPVVGLTLTPDRPTVPVGETISFVIHVDKGSDVTYTVDFGNGDTATYTRATVDWDQPDDKTVEYVYGAPCPSCVASVLASSAFGDVGPVNVTSPIIVLYGVPPLALGPDQQFVPFGSTDFVLSLEDATDQAPSFPLSCTWTATFLADAFLAQVEEMVDDSVITDQTWSVTTLGEHSLTVTCSNPASERNTTLEFVVEIPIAGFRVNFSEFPLMLTDAEFNLTVDAGSDVTYSVDFGDGTDLISVEAAHPDLGAGTTNVKHEFQKSGTYDVSITAKNDLGSETKTVTVSVLGLLPEDILLSTSSPVEYVAGEPATVTFNLSIAEKDRIPLPCEVYVDYADGAGIQAPLACNMLDDIIWKHDYTAPNFYSVLINLTTISDSRELETEVSVQERLSDVTIRYYPPGDETADKKDYPAGLPLLFVAEHDQGTGATYTWTFTRTTDGATEGGVSTEPALQYVLTATGTYDIHVTADNEIGNGEPGLPREATSEVTITEEGLISRFDYPVEQLVGYYGFYTVTLSSRYANDYETTCIRLRLGDTTIWLGSLLRYCTSVDPDVDDAGYEARQISETQSVRHAIDVPGTVYVEATALLQSGESYTVVGTVEIKSYCYEPTISTEELYQHLIYRRLNEITVPGKAFLVGLNCSSGTANRTVTLLDPDGRDVSDLMRVIGTEVFIEAFTLQYGVHTLVSTVTMSHSAELTASDSLTLEIVPSPTEVAFLDGPYRMVSVDELIPLNVRVWNPDFPERNETEATYQWFCYMEGEAELEDPPLINIPANYTNETLGLGGCFDSGPGQLNISQTQNVLVLNALVMPSNKTYVIKVHVTKKDEDLSPVQTMIQIMPFKVYDVSISCLTNCDTKVNRDAGVFVGVNCDQCPIDTNYKWSTYVVGSDLRADDYPNQRDIFIGTENLPEGQRVVVELNLESRIGIGRAMYEMIVTYAPRSGSCRSDVPEGDTGTKFNFICSDWEDDGWAEITSAGFVKQEGAILDYSYSYVDSLGIEHMLASVSTLLPSGHPDKDYIVPMKAYITDQYGCKAITSFEVKVKPSDNPYLLNDIADQLTVGDISMTVVNLESHLDTLSVVATEIISMLSFDTATTTAEDGTEGGDDTSAVLQPSESTEEELAKEKEKAQLEILDKAVGHFGAILDSDVELSPTQKVSMANTLSAIKLPTKTLPTTMNSMLNSADTLADSLSPENIPKDLEARETLTKGVMGAANNVVEAAKDKLSLPEVTLEDIEVAVLDQRMTEEEEALLQEQILEKEKAYAELRTNVMNSMIAISDQIGNGLASTDIPETTIQTDTMAISLKKIEPGKEATIDLTDEKGTSSVALFDMSSFANDTFKMRMTAIDKAVFGVGSDGEVDGPVVIVNLAMDNGTETSNKPDLILTQAQMNADDIPKNHTDSDLDEDTGMLYVYTNVSSQSDFSLNLEPEDEEPDVAIQVFAKINCTDVVLCRPNRTFYDVMFNLPQPEHIQPWLVTFHDVEGPIYIGIASESRTSRKKRDTSATNVTSVPLVISGGVSRCRAYSKDANTWIYANMSSNSTLGSPTCVFPIREDMLAYSSGFTVPTVNKIDFQRVFSQFATLLKDNNAVFITIIVIVVIYAVLAVWARRSDRKDVEKWGVLPLEDNPPNANTFYKLSIYTGLRRGAGTKSNIYFIMTGDFSDTGVRLLKDKKQRGFSTGSIRHFTLATEGSLGPLTFLRIWHDNSGKGESASWFLDKVIVEDLQNGQKYFFLCSQWLAIDEGDGLINRIIPVAGKEEIMGFTHLFFDKTRRKLFDDHLWFSVAGRPTRSNFTRLQRLSCILCLLATTMIANAMWFRQENVANDRVLRVGPIILSGATLLIAIYGSLTVMPINMLIVTLFRKHRPKDWPPEDAVIGADGEVIQVKKETPRRKKKWWKGKYPLPYWCAYIAWALVAISTILSFSFVILYSLSWGKTRSEEWLSSMLISIVQSVFFTQPLKVVFLAMILSLVFKTVESDDDDIGERHNNSKPGRDEELIDEDLKALRKLTMYQPPEMMNEEELAAAREKLKKDKEMWGAIKDSGFYFLFLLLLCFIVWGSKDELAFFNNNMLRDEIAGGNYELFKLTVKDGFTFWNWSRDVLVENLFHMELYNGKPCTPRERMYMSDGVNFRVGPLIMRQVRVKPESGANLPDIVPFDFPQGGPYSITNEEDRNFTLYWQQDPRDNYTEDELSRAELAFKFHGFMELKGTPFWGQMATYGGGGYVAYLGTTRGKARQLIDDLIEYGWIDRETRAVFVQLTTYNPNTNYFSFINFVFESPPTGGMLPYAQIKSFQLYTRLSGMTLVLVASQVLYMMLITFFMVREVLKFRKAGSDYWKDGWNYVEVALICTSWAALGLYVMKELIGRLVLSDLAKDKEKFINFNLFAYYEEVQWYVVGVIVFMADVKFLRVLRFNRHVSQFAGTLKQARPALLSFFVMFFFLFMAFTASGYLLFSSELYDFSTVISVMESLYSMLIGKFDVRQMEQTDRLLGPVYFALFMIIMYIVVVNIFLGILDSAYAEVCAMPTLAGTDYRVMEAITKEITKYLHLNKPTKKDEVHYMDSFDTLKLRLDSLDRMVTEECRGILGLDRRNNQDSSDDQTPDKKPDMDTKMQKLRFLARLHMHKDKSEPDL